MKISSSFNNIDKKQSYQTFKGIPKNQKYFPNALGKIGKVVGEYVNTPEQKLFLATTALMFQPLIDLKFADEDKKIDSAIKSASKAIAGGITGVTIRALFQYLTSNYLGVRNGKETPFYPRKAMAEVKIENPVLAEVKLNQYYKTMGTLFAVLFMIFFSNPKIDVPLTGDLQDLIGGVVKENKTWLKSLSDVATSRKNKIEKWIKKKTAFLTGIKNKINKITDIIKEKTPANSEKEKVK